MVSNAAVTKAPIAKVADKVSRAKPTVCPHNSQIAIVMIAIVITTGTNIPETLSATFAIGALVTEAYP